MAVAWATFDSSRPLPGHVAYSVDAGLANSASAMGDVRSFTVDTGRVWYTHTANMTGLKPSTKYYYQVLMNS
jgi:phosphodiesterase/alkaline phosphatase D-like protein